MARHRRIYTRTGDDGSTALATGQRLSKSALRIETYGTVDELNSVIGLALAQGCQDDVRDVLIRVQNDLFTIGSDLSHLPDDGSGQGVAGIEAGAAQDLETFIDHFSDELEPLRNFILPGGSRPAAVLHVARAVCRRAERLAVELSVEEKIDDSVLRYLNRLSDLLFTAARLENRRREIADVLWTSG